MLLLDSAEWLLVVISFFTSMFTGVFGLGGGVLLLALMPGMVPMAAIIPVHGAVQLVSNGSRAGFGLKTIHWKLLKSYIPGAVIGTLAGALLFQLLNPDYSVVLMGLVVLLITWLPVKLLGHLLDKSLYFGFGHSLLSAIAGAAGPLAGAYLTRKNLSRDALVTTLAAIMTASHSLKIVAFGAMGFSFADYGALIIFMMTGVTLGSLAGTRLRKLIPEVSFQKGFRVFITLLALRMISLPLFIGVA